MIKWFRLGNHTFRDFKEFNAVQDLAIANGLNSMEEFINFLDELYQ